MRTRFSTALSIAVLAAALGLATAGVSFGAEVYLAARPFTRPLPGVALPVPMWGFATCGTGFTACTAPSAPGPTVTVPAGDTALTVHLKNELLVPISLVIPGQPGAGDPVMVAGRVQSFTAEAAPGATRDYTWSSLRPGTYLYQSGTHPSIQVPMGLHGALVVQAAGYPGLAYSTETLLLYSEVDAVQNAAVDAAVTANSAAPEYPPAIQYNPQHSLVNGNLVTTPPGPVATPVGENVASPPLQTLLLRLANAGLRSHAASLVGLEMTLLAEDGNRYPSRKRQGTALLAAGKTLDTIVVLPAGSRTYPVYDRMLDLTNANQPGGGLLAHLTVGHGASSDPTPTAYAVPDTYTVPEDASPYNGASVLANDVGGPSSAALVNGPEHGTLTLNADGTFAYRPYANYSGLDTFTYSAIVPGGTTGAAVTLNVTFVNDRPVAAADGPYTNNLGAQISVPAPGLLGNDTDVDGDPLFAYWVSGSGISVNPDGSFSATGGGAGVTRTFTYQVCDRPRPQPGLCANSTATVTRRAPNGPTLTVRGPANELVGQYRWVLEEDVTFHPVLPPSLNPESNTLALNFHRSHMPVVAQGCVGPASSGCARTTALTQAVIDRTKHYFVSVLPANAGTGTGYTLGGAPIPPGATSVTVRVNQAPVPWAQIHVLVFEDNSPTNGAPDGNESGIGGFQIQLEDAAGRYGAAGGPMMFDAFGNPVKNYKDCGPGVPPPPDDIIVTCPDGTALIQNLPPGKYGVNVVPPAGAGVTWKQTSTIEGKRTIDAWVKAGEPAYFQEFGPPGYHVFVGFVSPEHVGAPGGSNTVKGTVTNLHMSRPPDQTLWDSASRAALAHTTAWVGLNSAGGIGPVVAVAPADADGGFTLSGVPDGSYQLVVWDEYLDQIIAFRNVTLSGSATSELGNVPVFQWFARLEHNVFLDENQNGIRDDEMTEPGLSEQNVNLRFRDGSIYLGAPTDGEGYVPFDETFPFFHWLVAEVDFTRHKATGVTVTVDGGGDAAAAPDPFTGLLNPQVQLAEDGGGTSRTETGPVLTQAFQGFLGQTNVLDWGKKPYAPGENGGISGIVYYATTRAEDDPRLGAGDPWEPGIPRVLVRLYRELKRSDGSTGRVFVAQTRSDSWDDSLPEGCPGADASDPVTPITKCYDGLRNFNQVRPGVFDGGYAFTECLKNNVQGTGACVPPGPGTYLGPLPPDNYVVELVPPPGYEIVKEEDKNVDFGDVFAAASVAMMLPNLAMVEVAPAAALVAAAQAPEPGLAQPECVGPEHTVPPYLTLFPGQLIDAPFAGAARPLCNRKRVVLNDRANGVADFHLFTATPVAGHGVGMILDDTAQEFNPASPQFGEKWAPPFVPVSFRDYTGREVSRVISDQWGRFNALVPSTFSANEPMFSGMSPSMMISCMNDPGPPPGSTTPDPNYNPVYGTFCYTLQYMPGTTTYLDTPVIPTAAFAAGFPPVDCAYPNGTPMIRQVNGSASGGSNVGPWIAGGGGTLTIMAQGTTDVPNPAYEGPQGTAPKTIQRDYGFGPSGTVSIQDSPVPLTVTSWSPTQITLSVPATSTTTAFQGQLFVTRADTGRTTMTAVTVHLGGPAPLRVTPATVDIQTELNNAAAGRLVMFAPGTYDRQLLIVPKPLRLQGAGPGSTFINAAKFPTTKLQDWRTRLESLLAAGSVNLLPQQEQGAGGIEPLTLNTEQGAGITVMGRSDARCTGVNPASNCFASGRAARIDGFTISGGDSAGAIYVNGWAHGLEISNNIVKGNSGLYHGGVRVGVPYFQELAGNGPFGFNRNLRIHHNQITHNGGLGGAGGGVMLCTGTDGYAVTANWVCGNFTQGHGAGIAHFGLSSPGLIERNKILFNQSFNQGLNVHGGGLLISGEPDPGAALGLGAGNVRVNANLVLGNQAGAGHGGGVRTQFVNGVDANAGDPSPYAITLTNNMVVNNVAGWAGGGISLQDTVDARIVNNTVAHNDSTATVGAAFISPTSSAPQAAGIVSEPHSPALAALVSPDYSNPTAFGNNIIWENRSFRYLLNATTNVGALDPVLTPSATGACNGGTPNYRDLGVIGGGTLMPTNSIQTPTNPSFVSSYCNTARSTRLIAEVTTLQTAPALDEGGNWIDVRYGPITLTRPDGSFFGNYHVTAGTNGALSGVTTDYDNQSRATPPDIGADEYVPPVPPLP